MSGGHFNYNEHRLDQLAEVIDQLIEDNEDTSLLFTDAGMKKLTLK
jgi:hypothetical protein